METCSNCGATNRESAKFCTSCGVRLPTLARSTATDWDRSGRETTAGAAATTLDPASTAPETAAPVSTTDASDRAAATDADAPPTWSWNEPTTSDAQGTEAAPSDGDAPDASADDISGQATGDDTAASTGGPAPDTSSTLSHWASQWTGEYAAAPEADSTRTTSGDLPAAEATPTDSHSDAGAPEAARTDAAAEVDANEAAWQAAIAEPVDGPERDHDTTATAPSGEPFSTGTGIESPSAVVGEAAQEDTLSTLAAGEQGGSLDRARALLDELHGLLPLLAAPVGGERAEAVGSEGASGLVAEELAAARAEGFDTAELRRALEAAQGRPRDVDTMLDLVGKVEPMLAALDAYDRLTAAVDRALGQLGQPGGEASLAAMQEQEPGNESSDSRFSWRRR